ncbi:MAG TPA: cation-translocating P-type ATPase [Pirellulales bacterium]|nr:cation-translocating P-type ATPase [Pirellulales bacterium]
MPQTTTYHIPALDCPDELALIQRSLRGTPGIAQIVPDYLSRNLHVEYDPAKTKPASIQQAIEAAGFPAQIALPVTSVQLQAAGESGSSRMPRPMIASGLLLLAATAARVLAGSTTFPVVALTIAATIVAGIPVAAAAWRAVRLRGLDMNVLMTVAATGAIAIGDYFEAATAMFLFAVSLWLERLSLSRAQRAIRSLVELAPNVAHRLLNHGTSAESVADVNPVDLTIGEQVLVRPGERIPTDGDVLTGESAVNQAPITGESVPVEKRPGEKVFAGTLNGEGALVLAVTRTAENSTLAHIARLVNEARATRSPTERFVDAFARRYTPVVIALALAMMMMPPLLAVAGVHWASAVGTFDWIQRGLVLLVIACPCALVISTPVTIVSGLHQAAHAGILVKGGEFLEKAAGIRCVALDKTGTITTGSMKVVGVEAFNGRSSEEVIKLAAALERDSEHPLARAISAAAVESGFASFTATSVTALRGLGVRGEISGNSYFLGNARIFAGSEFQLSNEDAARLKEFDVSAATMAWIGTFDRLLGVIRLADQPRQGVAEAIAQLRGQGVERIVMLTGDNTTVAKAIAREIGIEEVHADLLPQDKIERVKTLAGKGGLAMVGDGVNDAPALAAADVGIALGGQSSDTALETADVVVMNPDLSKVADLIRLSRRCRRILQQNIGFALATKLGVMILAAFGDANMWMAVAADVGASMLVIANSLRIIKWQKPL